MYLVTKCQTHLRALQFEIGLAMPHAVSCQVKFRILLIACDSV